MRDEKNKELEKSIFEMLLKIVRYIENLEPYSKGHASRVSKLAKKVGTRLNLSEETCRHLELAGILHDIGKLGISDSLLLKSGSLDKDEWEKIKTHPIISVNLLETFQFLKPIIPMIKHHHEKYDGTGYPEGLKSLDIPLGARILVVADCFDALISDRAFRKRFLFKDALQIIENNLGKNFDPEIGKVFLTIIKEEVNSLSTEG